MSPKARLLTCWKISVGRPPSGLKPVCCNLSNNSDYDMIVANVYVIDENSTQGNYARAIPIPPGSSAKVITNGERLILPETAGLRINSDTEASIDATISYVEIS